jgi:hypothetical protein
MLNESVVALAAAAGTSKDARTTPALRKPSQPARQDARTRGKSDKE